jgi:hypothetical protein
MLRLAKVRWTKYFYKASSHAKMEASERHNAVPSSVLWLIAWACSMALRFISRSVVAYRLVVVTLACPSHWLIVRIVDPGSQQMYRGATAHAVGV